MMVLVEILLLLVFFSFVMHILADTSIASKKADLLKDKEELIKILELENQKLNKKLKKLEKKVPQFDKDALIESLRNVSNGEEKIYEDGGKSYTTNEIIENIKSGTLLGEEFCEYFRNKLK